MTTHTVFTLRDGSRFDTIEKAMNHCDEMMGAETRDMLDDILCSHPALIQVPSLKLVADKKYDEAIFEYVAWRKERDELEAYQEPDCPCQGYY